MDPKEHRSQAQEIFGNARSYLGGSAEGLSGRGDEQIKNYTLDELLTLIKRLESDYQRVKGW